MNTGRCTWRKFNTVVGFIVIAIVSAIVGVAQTPPPQQDRPFRGGLNPVTDQETPRPVRNDVAQPGEEIVTLRYFRIKKGTFDQFLKASKEGVWPYFEKLGSRVIGMWQVIAPSGVEGVTPLSKDYDEVYLSTGTQASNTGRLHARQFVTVAMVRTG